MPVTVIEQFIFGGVDSRSNPLNMPPTRSLRCRNWVPMQGGWLQLRNGYSQVAMSSVVNAQIHSLVNYKTWGGTRLVIFFYPFAGSSVMKKLDLSTGTVTTITNWTLPTAKISSCFANNRVFMVNGDQAKFYDGATIRTMGLAAPTSTEVSGVLITLLVRALTTTEVSATTVAGNGAGGSFAATISSGFQNYVINMSSNVAFDNNYYRSRASLVGSRITLAGATSKIAFTNLPNYSTVDVSYLKVLGSTTDGGSDTVYPWVASTKSVTSSSSSGNVVTYTIAAHGFSVNDIMEVAGSSRTDHNGTFILITSVPDANTVVGAILGTTSGSGVGGTAYKYVSVANATTSKDVTANTQAPTGISLATDQFYGLDASTIGGAQPGFKFYLCFYLAATGHVGNRITVATRVVPVAPSIYQMGSSGPSSSLGGGSPSAISAGAAVLVGRTGDGGEVPYACVDTGLNLTTGLATLWSILTPLTNVQLDYNRELPTRNTVPPAAIDKIIRVGDRLLANASGSPYIFRSESELDTRTGIFFGNPQESWPSTNFETFPTAQAVSCIAEQDQECYAFSLNDMAILIDLAGILQWVGPFNVGCAGQRAFAKTPYGPFWVTGDKQLATTGAKGPIIISEEYEAALLSKIGDAYLSQVEVAYYRDASKHIDHLKIKALDTNGVPFIVIHDFRLRDPLDAAGQGYDQVYLGQLASEFTMAQVRDNNDKLAIYVGAANGRIYQLESGLTDDSNEYSADYVALLNAGPNRVTVPHMEWFGDPNVTVEIGNDLDGALADTEATIQDTNPEEPSGFAGRAFLPHPEVRHPYVRLRLTSHSSGNTFALNDPVHMPLETYGRIWVLRPSIGEQRGGQ